MDGIHGWNITKHAISKINSTRLTSDLITAECLFWSQSMESSFLAISVHSQQLLSCSAHVGGTRRSYGPPSTNIGTQGLIQQQRLGTLPGHSQLKMTPTARLDLIRPCWALSAYVICRTASSMEGLLLNDAENQLRLPRLHGAFVVYKPSSCAESDIPVPSVSPLLYCHSTCLTSRSKSGNISLDFINLQTST